MKKLLTSAALIVLMLTVSLCMFTAEGINSLPEDPADSYVKKTAPNEDSDISLWFEPSFKKVLTSDTVSSGKDTYSVYMAKNEIENAQFVLYSDTDKTKISANVTNFTNANGDTIPARIYYEMYVTVDSVNPDSILGADDSSYLIRSGETPDPVIPLSRIRTFKLNGGKSQAFFIRLESSEQTPSGWYSATLNITDSSKNIIKTAEVYAYVWDFVISEKTELQTAFYITNSDGSYKKYYDYLLDNRLCAMDIPMQGTTYMDPSNPYFTNERVSAIRVSDSGCGNTTKYLDTYPTAYAKYSEIYDRMKSSDIWETVKDKLYFYTADEPLPVPDDHVRDNANDVIERTQAIRKVWDNPRIVVPICEEHAYPNASYTQPLSAYTSRDLYDSTQAFMDNDSLTIWCPRIYAFTPKSEIDAYGKYAGIENGAGWSDQIRTMSGPYSGAFSNSYYTYFNWEAVNGYYADRFNSYMSVSNAAGKNVESWAYSAGWNKSYSYCNHLIENTGIQTKMLFWQLYQEDITGYLYYGSNLWSENDYNNGVFEDTTVTGDKSTSRWKTNKLPYANGYSIYGNGVLFYNGAQAQITGVSGVVGSLRVEIMRDGVEEYQMFKMLEELKGESAAKSIISKVSANVVNYLSLPNFKASEKSDDIDDYDYMESVRRELGNAVEAAGLEEKCEHSWNNGSTTKEATCLEMGEILYKCTKCGAEKTDYIPTLHTAGDTFEIVSGSAATCTQDSSIIFRCKVCKYEKRDRTKAFHLDPSHYVYESKNSSNHNIKCGTCGKQLDVGAHALLTRNTATCTEDGVYEKYCRYCDYTEETGKAEALGHALVSKKTLPTCTEDGFEGLACTRCDYTEANILPATGHSYVDGVCTVCGKNEADVNAIPGDINRDETVNSKDSNLLKRIISGKFIPTEAQFLSADIDKDGSVTTKDSFLLKKLIISGQ